MQLVRGIKISSPSHARPAGPRIPPPVVGLECIVTLTDDKNWTILLARKGAAMERNRTATAAALEFATLDAGRLEAQTGSFFVIADRLARVTSALPFMLVLRMLSSL